MTDYDPTPPVSSGEDYKEYLTNLPEFKEALACIKTAQKYGSGAPDYDDDPEEILEWYRKGI